MKNKIASRDPVTSIFDKRRLETDDLGFDRLVSPRTAAQLLDVSVKFIYECIARREIEAERVGGRLRRIRLSTLEAWLTCKNQPRGSR